MRRVVAIAMLLLCLTSCRDPYSRGAWDSAGVSTARGIATKVQESSYGCDKIQEDPYTPYSSGYKEAQLPLPLASVHCTSPALREDLTIETFDSAEAAQAFVEAKVKAVCKKGEALGPGFEKLPYVDGGTWLVEPDTRNGSKRVSEVLGAPAKTMCP